MTTGSPVIRTPRGSFAVRIGALAPIRTMLVWRSAYSAGVISAALEAGTMLT